MNAAIQVLAEANAATGARKPVATEWFGVFAFFALVGILAWRLAISGLHSSPIWIALATIAGYIGADLFSGLVHWGFDTWGRPATPVLGKAFIIPFRIHHVDPKDITRHGFIATNGHNCLATVPVLAGALFIPLTTGWGAPLLVLLLSLCLGIFGTNQFHKWAHEDEAGPIVDWMQRLHLILPRVHHSVHHTAPYLHHYCITSGWLNEPLRAIGFFRALERAIRFVTKAVPRQDDLETTGATEDGA